MSSSRSGRNCCAGKLARALALRERFVGGAHYRLVYGESDGLPGLVVDRYGDVLVGQIATLAMDQRCADDRGSAAGNSGNPDAGLEERRRRTRSGSAAHEVTGRWRRAACDR